MRLAKTQSYISRQHPRTRLLCRSHNIVLTMPLCILVCRLFVLCFLATQIRGTYLLTILQDSSATFEIGDMIAAREGFKSRGNLTNQVVAGAQPKSDDTYNSTLALSKNLGIVDTATTVNALFTVGIVRDPSIRYKPSIGASSEFRAPCFKSAFGSVEAAVSS